MIGKNVTCATCVYFGDEDCRRRPPMPIKDGRWPYVDASDWCGEHSALQLGDWVCAGCGARMGKTTCTCEDKN